MSPKPLVALGSMGGGMKSGGGEGQEAAGERCGNNSVTSIHTALRHLAFPILITSA